MGQTVVMVTHDPVAAAHADAVLFLADGRIVGQLERPCGAVASLVTVVLYSIARTDSAVPPTGALVYVGVVAVAAALTLGASLGAARRAIRPPAVEAAAVAAA
jgi:ABC-type sulfate/molybdate transport systems ATPase subunit